MLWKVNLNPLKIEAFERVGEFHIFVVFVRCKFFFKNLCCFLFNHLQNWKFHMRVLVIALARIPLWVKWCLAFLETLFVWNGKAPPFLIITKSRITWILAAILAFLIVNRASNKKLSIPEKKMITSIEKRRSNPCRSSHSK